MLHDVVRISHLITISFTGRTFRLTDCSQDVFYSNWYTSQIPIEFTPINSEEGETQGITIKISNIDKSLSDLVLAEDTRNKPVLIQRVYLDKNMAVVGTPTTVFKGYTDAITVDRKEASIAVYDELIKWKTLTPRRIHSSTCTWQKFKGTECGYAGAEAWCDRTWARCMALTSEAAVEGALAYEDGVGYTNETAAANNGTVNDMNLFPDTPSANDAYYFGLSSKWGVLKLNVTTKASVGTTTPGWTLIWEYWNGAWVAVPSFVDPSRNYYTVGNQVYDQGPFSKAGLFYFCFPLESMTDWIESTIQTITSYWVRVRVSAYTGISAPPKAGQVWANDGQFLKFGGFRFLTALATAEIWWGSKAKSWANYLKY